MSDLEPRSGKLICKGQNSGQTYFYSYITVDEPKNGS